MSRLRDLMQESGLLVLVAQADSAAEEALQLELAGDQTPIWSWKAGEGIRPVCPGEPALSLEEGAFPNEPVDALDAFYQLEVPAVLLVFGADRLRRTDRIEAALQRQQLPPDSGGSVYWVMLVSGGGDLGRLLGDLGRPLAEITYRCSGAAPAGPSITPAPRAEKLDLADIETLADFDRPEWTAAIQNMPAAQLQKIVVDKLYQPGVARLGLLQTDLMEVFVDKDPLIRLMMQCSVAHLPMLLLGTWGTGKSMLVRQVSLGLGIAPHHRAIVAEDELVRQLMVAARRREAAGGAAPAELPDLAASGETARYFEYLVTRFTTPEELLGAVNVEVMLTHAVHLRQTRALLPRAEIAFLDEVFKANSAILNALLSIINERLFYNAGLPWLVNLVMLFAASNEPPQEEDLGAFYDRFPVRALCDPVPHDKLDDLLNRAHTDQFRSLMSPGASDADLAALDPGGKLKARSIRQRACVNDFRLLRRICLLKFGGIDTRQQGENAAFTATYLRLFRHLRDEYDVSDRSCGHFYRLARARALLQGRDKLEDKDARVLRYCGKTVDALRQLGPVVDEFLA